MGEGQAMHTDKSRGERGRGRRTGQGTGKEEI